MKPGKRDMLDEGHCKISWIWEGASANPDTSMGMHEGKPVIHHLKGYPTEFLPSHLCPMG